MRFIHKLFTPVVTYWTCDYHGLEPVKHLYTYTVQSHLIRSERVYTLGSHSRLVVSQEVIGH